MRPIISSIKNSLLFVFSLLVCLGLLELYLNYIHTREHALLQVKYADRDLCTTSSDDPLLIYTYIPDKCGANSQGYLDTEHEFLKQDSSYRIIVIGDSVAQGQGVSLKDSFGKVLERKINAAQDYLYVEVIILADCVEKLLVASDSWDNFSQ